MRRTRFVFPAFALAFALSAGSAAAQDFQKHHITAGLGAGLPLDELGAFYNPGFSWSFGYGYRPFRNLQFDAGLDTVYHSADVNSYVSNPTFGFLRVRDFEYMVPLGARGVLPLKDGRFNVYGGGGAAYIRYSESLEQPSGFFRVSCPFCRSRDGWGYYFLAGGDVALTEGGGLRLGVTTRVYQVTTSGPSVGQLPPVETRDRWVNTYIHLTFSF